MIVGADAANDQTILDTSANLYGSYKLKRVYYSAFSPIPDASRALPLQRAAAGARAPALSGRLADAVLRFRCRRDRREAAGMLSLDIDPKLAWALRHRDRFPLDIASASREELAARARLRHQGGRPHHRDPPRDLDPRRRSRRGCTSPATRRCRSSFSAITARSPHLLDSARWRSGSSRRRRNWDLGFRPSLRAQRKQSSAHKQDGLLRASLCNDEGENHALHHPRQRNRFRRLAQSGARRWC